MLIIFSCLFLNILCQMTVNCLETSFDRHDIEAASIVDDFIQKSFIPQPLNKSFYEIESILLVNPLDNEHLNVTGAQLITKYEQCSRLPIDQNKNYSLFNSFGMNVLNPQTLLADIKMPFISDPPTLSIPFLDKNKYCIASNEQTFALGIENSLRPPVQCMRNQINKCGIELFGLALSNDATLVNLKNRTMTNIFDGIRVENVSLANKFVMQFYLDLPAKQSLKKLLFVPFDATNNSGFHFR